MAFNIFDSLKNIWSSVSSGISSYNNYMEGLWSKAYDYANTPVPQKQDVIQKFLDDSSILPNKKKEMLQSLKDWANEEDVRNHLATNYYPETQVKFQETLPTASPWMTGNKWPMLWVQTAANILPSLYNTAAWLVNTASTAIQEWPLNTANLLAKWAIKWAWDIANTVQQTYQNKWALQWTSDLLWGLNESISTHPVEYASSLSPKLLPKAGKALVQWAKLWTDATLKAASKVPSNVMKWLDKANDIIDTWVEKSAGKIIWSSDWSKELFKATSPSYNTLSKSKDIKNLQTKARNADIAVLEKWYKPTTTTERVAAYEWAMKSYWNDVEKARWWTKETYNPKEVADIIDNEVANMKVNGKINPAITADADALMKQADYFRNMWNIDVPTLGKQRAILNANTQWWPASQYGDTFNSVMKKALAKIREVEDGIISKGGSDAIKKYWSIRQFYDDVLKQDIKASRAKWMWVEESFSRISGIPDIIGWVVQMTTNPRQWAANIASGASKVLLWKVAWKLKDPDYLIRTGYEKLLNSTKNGNNPWNPPTGNTHVNPIPTPKAKWKVKSKPLKK